MERVVYRAPEGGFEWIDVVAPSPGELRDVAARHGLHEHAVEDCLDPWHLPKHERFDGTTFVILRAFDPQAAADASSVQELTRKIAVFVQSHQVLTVHRVEMGAVKSVEERFAGGKEECGPGLLLGALVNAALDTYAAPLEQAEDLLDEFEEALFARDRRTPPMLAIHSLKRRVSVVKRLIWQTSAVIQRLVPPTERSGPVFQDMRDNADGYHFYAEQLLDEINNLLGIHVALASHRTNEVMRVLTVFSAFFLPLTFIVGVYGMNFRHMPELPHPWGYPMVWAVMIGVSVAIWLWFRRRRWL